MTIRVGILGASAIAPAALVEPIARHRAAEVVSVAARRPGAAAAFAGRWGIPRSETRYEAVIRDPGIDVVYVSLAARDHALWSIEALGAGKHVLCEKPAAVGRAEAEAMAAAAERSGRLLVEAFHYRWHPLFARVLSLVAEGSIGRVRRLESVIVGNVPFTPGSVLHEPSLGGGALLHSGCYAVHWMRLLQGAQPRVTGFAERGVLSGADTASRLELMFPGQVDGVVTSSFERERTLSDPPELVVEGTKGRIEVNGLIVPQYGNSLRIERTGRSVDISTVSGSASYDYQLDAFFSALDDPAAAAAFRRDLVDQAVVLESARLAPRGRLPFV